MTPAKGRVFRPHCAERMKLQNNMNRKLINQGGFPMKQILPVIAGAVAFSMAPAGVAAATDNGIHGTSGRHHHASSRYEAPSSGRHLAHPLRASELIGREIKDPHKEPLGEVSDLLLDLESGRVGLAVVSSGGVLGVNSRDTLVPPETLSYNPSTKTLVLDVDPAKFKAAPEVDLSVWEQADSPTKLNETYVYYGKNPYTDERTGKDQSVTPTSSGLMRRASRIIGLPVVNSLEEKIGVVNDLVIDLPVGRIVHVVVSSSGFRAVGDTLSAVPPAKFRHVSAGDALQVNLTKEELTHAPHFKSSEWPDFGDAGYTDHVYRAYGVAPYQSAGTDHPARNQRDREEPHLTPSAPASVDADVSITRRIQKAVKEDDRLSLKARNIKIITVSGRVTLRGPVTSDAEKEAVFKIAQAMVPNGSVDNQIEVKPEP